MKPVLLEFGTAQLSSFILMMAAGACVFLWVSVRSAERAGLSPRDLAWSLVAVYLGGLAGARALFVMQNRRQWLDAWQGLWNPMPGGFVSFGGLFGGCLALLLCARWFRFSVRRAADSMATGGCLFAAIARIGCYLGGCCHGRPTTMPWGVVFPVGSDAALRWGAGVPVHPAQLYESAFLFAVAVISLRTPLAGPPGNRFLVLLATLAAGRFCFEFVRGDGTMAAAGLTEAQWFAALIAAASLAALVTLRCRPRLTLVG
ncbi:MAG: prolipoprotein diacylglyceryl transferase [Candidatus Solibacter sp.]|nr:prolipoprotein diacylglyceryl transferase [Candidatus Solibacter sp.]